MNNIRSIGAEALKLHGAEGLTLSQLSQVEDEGLWAEDIGPKFLCDMYPDQPKVLCFLEGQMKRYLREHVKAMFGYSSEDPDDIGQ